MLVRQKGGRERGRQIVGHVVGTRLQIHSAEPCVSVEKWADPVPYAQPMTRTAKTANLLTVVLPPLLIVAAIVVFWNAGRTRRMPNAGMTSSSEQPDVSCRSKTRRMGRPARVRMTAGS